MSSAYEQLRQYIHQTALLQGIDGLLNWDQETYMPPAAAPIRAEQAAAIATLVHERRTSRRFGDMIAACEADRELTREADSPTARNIAELRRAFDKATKLPTSLVAELAKVGSQAQEVWKHARERNDFPEFAPWLGKMMDLTRQKAECYGVPAGGELYDALLDDYEPDARAAEIERVFKPLADRLSALVRDLLEKGKAPGDAPLRCKIDASRQHAFGNFVVETLGFDLSAGRLDVTTHPFCSGFAPGDTRLTTRYRDEKFTDALYGTMHECGHGLYEQGLPKQDYFGEPLGDSISLGIHESQSRMWENFVGRSREFWAWALPHAQKTLGSGLEKFTVDDLFSATNLVQRSFIRVEADEATYNLHVMLRFGIERALIKNELPVKDLPGVWNERFEKLLGVKVPDDRRGCLQDVHWSFGLIGYFPTYTLGNLYAAQFWEKINADIPDLKTRMSRGEFAPLLGWLREKIHVHGKRWKAGELCERITGRPLSADPLLRHLGGKLRPIYKL
ncbi:MAG TPA: carboxypeptidase M32 [Phycisphaerales bacterium]|nr:carboxypeptidase M32 [Phycisphaerales bacterium]